MPWKQVATIPSHDMLCDSIAREYPEMKLSILPAVRRIVEEFEKEDARKNMIGIYKLVPRVSFLDDDPIPATLHTLFPAEKSASEHVEEIIKEVCMSSIRNETHHNGKEICFTLSSYKYILEIKEKIYEFTIDTGHEGNPPNTLFYLGAEHVTLSYHKVPERILEKIVESCGGETYFY